MRYLTDTEILAWNDKLTNTNYMLRPRSHNRSGNVDIVFVQKVASGLSHQTFVETTDPFISFKYLFSISSNRVKDFWEIFNRRKSISLGTCTNYNDKYEPISFDENHIVLSKDETKHKIKEKEYTRFSYELKGKFSQIIAFITVIQDSIKFFSKLWGYTEDGKEVSLLDFPIGSVCSMKSDKSNDYIVLDYEYTIIFNEYRIDYKIAKMEWKENSPIVTYGEIQIASEVQLCFSRNSRIDDILEN